jgi:preprotein translocase subunit SecG
MNVLWNLVVVVQILAALVMIGLVLIQHGKGADMGASFGSGASGSLFGATGSANFMSRSTAVCAGLFFVCTLALAYFSNDRGRASTGGSVLDRPAISAPAGSAPASGAALTGAAQVPGAGSAPALARAPAAAASAAPAPAASGAGAIPTR